MKMKGLTVLLYLVFHINYVILDSSMEDIPHYLDFLLKAIINETKCVNQIESVLKAASNLETWPLLFFDASAKLQPSLLTGNVFSIGGYDECMDINVRLSNDEIKGQYCKTNVMVSPSTTKCIYKKFKELQINGLGKTSISELEPYQSLHYDVCVPDGCSAKNLQNLWNALEEKLKPKFTVQFDEILCTTVEKQNIYPVLDIVIITFFSVMACIVVLSTAYDIYFCKIRGEKGTLDFMKAFSFYTNGKRLLKVQHRDSQIKCLAGIRSISLAWIIVGHRTLFNFSGYAINSTYMFDWFKKPANMFIIGAFPNVDTFFLIGGLLIVYVQMASIEKGAKINVIMFYIHRVLRLTPALAATVLIHLGVVNHLGSGPFWVFIDGSVTSSCRENWWKIMLYVQNYLTPWTGCITHTWYLAVDMQLYFISPLIVIPLLRWTKYGIGLIIALFIASNACAVYMVYDYEIDDASIRSIANYWEHIYLPTHLRITPWLIGILMGYYMFSKRNKKVPIKKKYVLVLWVVAIILLLIVMYGYILLPNIKFNLLQGSIFMVLSRICWSVGVGWVIFACEKGCGGIINKFLSSYIFTVLGRLSYSMYLTHFLVIVVTVHRERSNMFIDNFTQFYKFWGDYVCCLVLSVIWTLTFESPIPVLEKMILKRTARKKTGRDAVNNDVKTISQMD